MLKNEQKGILYAVASGFSFGLLGYFGITLMHADLSLYTMLFWRFVVGALVLIPLLIPFYKEFFKDPEELLRVFVYGILFYSTTAILYFLACQYIGTGLAMVTFFTYPVIVILLNKIFYKTFIPKSYYTAVGLILCGMILLGGNDYATFDYRGLALGVSSALTYAAYVILSKKSSLMPLVSTFMVSIGCIVTCFFAAYMEGTFCVPQGLSVWINIIAVGTLCTALPMLLLLKALQYISSEKTSLLSVLEPVFVLIFGVLLLGETITPLQIIGIIIVLSGAIITLFGTSKKKN